MTPGGALGCSPYCGGGLNPPWKCCASTIDDYFPRLLQARAEGWLNRSVFCFGWMLARSKWNPRGWSHSQLRNEMTRLNASFPELAGVAFYGHPPGNASKAAGRDGSRAGDTATLELIRYASGLAEEFYPDPRMKSDDADAKNVTSWADSSDGIHLFQTL